MKCRRNHAKSRAIASFLAKQALSQVLTAPAVALAMPAVELLLDAWFAERRSNPNFVPVVSVETDAVDAGDNANADAVNAGVDAKPTDAAAKLGDLNAVDALQNAKAAIKLRDAGLMTERDYMAKQTHEPDANTDTKAAG